MKTQLNKETLLFILILIALLPVMIMRDFTPANELRYLSIADEALRNHTFFAFTNHGVAYADKPPFYLWLVMLLRYVCGSHEMWVLSLLSLVPAGVIVHVMDRWASQELPEESRTTSRLLLITTGLFLGSALTVRMDMLMCMFIVLAMRSFWGIYTGKGSLRNQLWLFACYTFMALFTKGPLGLLFPIITGIVFLAAMRQWKMICKIVGWRTWTILIGGCAVWWGLTYAEGGAEYLNNLLFHQTMDRAVNAFHHSRPFHFYFVCMWYCIAPWSAYAAVSLIRSFRKGNARSPLYIYFLLSGITVIVLLSCISSKLQVYMLPAVPFLIYASAINFRKDCNEPWCRICLGIPAAIFMLALPAAAVYTFVATPDSASVPFVGYVAAGLLTCGGLMSIWQLLYQGNQGCAKAIRFTAYSLFAAVFVGAFALATMGGDMGYREVSQKAIEMATDNGIHDFTAWKMKNASDMDVYLGRDVNVLPDCSTAADSIKRPTLLIAPTDKVLELKLEQVTKTEAAGKYSIFVLK